MTKRETYQNAIWCAYQEGFDDGQNHGNLDYKYPPIDIAWLQSETRERIHGLNTKEQNLSVLKWSKAKYNDRVSGEWNKEATE